MYNMKVKIKWSSYFKILLVTAMLVSPLVGQQARKKKQQKNESQQSQQSQQTQAARPNTNKMTIPLTPSFDGLDQVPRRQIGYFLDIAVRIDEINRIDRFKPYNNQLMGEISQLFSKAADIEPDPCAGLYLQNMAHQVLQDSFYSTEPAWFNLEKNHAEILVLQNKQALLRKIIINRLFPLDNMWLDQSNMDPADLSPAGKQKKKIRILDTFVFVNDFKQTHKYEEYGRRFRKIRNNLPYNKKLSVPYDAFAPRFKIADLFYSNGVQGPNLLYPGPESFFVQGAGKFKIIIFKNLVKSYLDCVLNPVSEKILLNTTDSPVITVNAYISNFVMNRISHQMGHVFELVVKNNQIKKKTQVTQDIEVDLDARKQEEKRKPKTKTIRELKLVSTMIGPWFRVTEEVKAHALTLHNTSVLLEEGLISKEEEMEIYSTYIVTLVDRIRRNRGKQFNRANLVLFNYLLRNGAVIFDLNTRKLYVHAGQFPQVVEKLSQFMVNKFRYYYIMLNKYGKVSSELKELLDKLSDVPMYLKTEFKFDPKEYNGKISN